jgi:hypothetical protein
VYAAVSCAAFAFAACSTYGDGLLSHAQDSASVGGAGGTANGGDTVAIVGGSSDLGGTPVVVGGGVGAGAGSGVVDDAGAAGAAGNPDIGGASGSASVGGGGASGGHAGATNTTGGSAGSGAAGATGGGSSGGPAIELIDDFEDQNFVVLLMNRRNGPWYNVNDGTKAGVQAPLTIAVLTGTANARPGSTSTAALHTTATGFTSWGAGVGADFVNTGGVKVPYDVSAYKGIRFYAKIGAGTQPGMKLLIPTTYSDPLGGKCNNTASPPAGTACNDHLFCPINSLKATWDVYECDFSDLMQQSFGLPQAKLDPTSVYGLQFTLATTPLAADFWLDDVAFVLK